MRRKTWRRDLARLIRWASGASYRMGHMDCFCFAGAACFAVAGIDPMRPWRGRYSSAIGAAALLGSHGADSQTLWSKAFGAPVSQDRLGAGDLIECPAPGTDELRIGVVGPSGESVYAFGTAGLMSWPFDRATPRLGWVVGHQ